MPITATLSTDSRRFITLSNSAQSPSSALSVTAVQSGSTLTFTPADGTTPVVLQVPLGWSGISVGGNVTLTIGSDLIVGKAILGSGTAIALAPMSGGNLSGQALFADVIQLTAGQAYTLSASQASMARIDQGPVGNLTSAGVITVVAPSAYDLSSVALDSGDVIVLTAGVNYTLTASQAAIARVGATGKAGTLTSTGELRIVAPLSADLSGLVTDSNDTLVLTAGVSYTLSANQVAVAQVGSSGTKGDLTTAGTILVKASATGDATLHAMTATGVDIIQLTAGQAYTITPAQADYTRVGPSGSLGDLRSGGVVTVKADTAPADLSEITTDSNDVLLLGSGIAYTLTSQQALRAKVVTAGVQGNSGDLTRAGQITVLANPKGENLAATTVQGVDFHVLTAGSDYVLTSAQARYSKVGTGDLGALSTAGLISIRGVAGEDFTATITAIGITGADVLLLTPGQAYTLTAEQAKIARVVDASGVPGKSGALGSTGVLTVKADTAAADLTTLGTDSNDVIVLGAGLSYVLTAAQAVGATVATGSGSGLLTKTANLSVIAPSAGGDLSGLANVTGIQSLVLSPGKKYSLPTTLASVVQIGSGALGSYTNAGPLTATASSSEDLSINPLAAVASAILLTPGQDYKLTAAQAAVARFASTSALGDLRQIGAAKPGVVTVLGTGASDLSKLLTDGNVNMVLANGQNTTLTAAQALKTTVGTSTVAGDLTAAGVVTVKAPYASSPVLDVSAIALSSNDVLQLAPGGNYTLSKAQVPLARVGAGLPGDLRKAGMVSVSAAPEDDLTSLASSSFTGIDNYLLTSGVNYTLSNSQAAISKVGTAATGVLTSPGVLTIVATPGADLSALGTDGNDVIQLTSGASYTLSFAQALSAQLVSSSSNGPVYGTPGQLDSAGQITLRAPAATGASDLTVLLANVTGVDTIVLNAGQAYMLSAGQAGVAQIGNGGTRGDLGSTGVITVLAGSTQDLSAIKTDSNDILQLDDATDYTLTAAQALIARIGTTGKAGALGSTGDLRILAQVSGDFSTLGTDSDDMLVLWPGQRYALTTTQAANARVWTGSAIGPQGDLSSAGAVRLIASTVAKATEDLSALTLESTDIIQLTAGVNYTLTAAQAAIAQIGVSGRAGDLIGSAANAGNIVVRATSSADVSAIKLDNAGDQLILSAVVGSTPCDYTLSPAQLAIAQVDNGIVGDFTGAGTVTVRASATGDDLTTGPAVMALGIDAYQLSPMQSYTLLASQLPFTRVGSSGTLGSDLSAAGVVNVKADMDNLSPLSDIRGIDAYILTPGASYSLTASQALLSKMGATGSLGVLTSPGKLSISAPTAADLSPLITDSGDAITLTAGLNYSLNPLQLGISSVYTAASGNTAASTSTAGDLRNAGTITLRADSSADLSGLSALGVDGIALTVGRDYIMTTAQAQMAKVGTGNSGVLNKAGVITLKPVSAGENLSTTLASVTGYDVLQLNDASNYTLTAAQAALSRIGPLGSAGNLISTGELTITASASANLSRLQLDSNDTVLLTRGSASYTLSAQQAGIARLTDGTTSSLPGQLSHSAGTTINVLAKANGEDLSGMIVSGLDAIILTPGQNYTLTTAQAPIAKVGATGTAGNLIKAYVTLTGINGTANAELLVGGVRDDTITGFGGNDTMTGGAGKDTFFLSGTAFVNGSDTITDFVPGANGDVIKLSTFMTRLGTTTSSTSLTSLSSASTTTVTTGNVYVLDAGTAIANKDYAGLQFNEIFSSTAVLHTTTAAESIKGVLVVRGTDLTKIYYIDNTVDAVNTNISNGDVGLVATLTGVTSSSTAFVTENFV